MSKWVECREVLKWPYTINTRCNSTQQNCSGMMCNRPTPHVRNYLRGAKFRINLKNCPSQSPWSACRCSACVCVLGHAS